MQTINMSAYHMGYAGPQPPLEAAEVLLCQLFGGRFATEPVLPPKCATALETTLSLELRASVLRGVQEAAESTQRQAQAQADCDALRDRIQRLEASLESKSKLADGERAGRLGAEAKVVLIQVERDKAVAALLALKKRRRSRAAAKSRR